MPRPNRKLILIIAIIIVALSSLAAYQKRIPIAARIWQLRHHGVLSFAGYSIPIPRNWYVQDNGTDGKSLFRLDSAQGPSDDGWHVPSTIALMDVPPLQEVDNWKAIVIASFKKQGAEPEFRDVVSLDSEIFTCIGGNVLPTPPSGNHPAPVAWHCKSTGHLEILITASQGDISQCWDLISRMRSKIGPKKKH